MAGIVGSDVVAAVVVEIVVVAVEVDVAGFGRAMVDRGHSQA